MDSEQVRAMLTYGTLTYRMKNPAHWLKGGFKVWGFWGGFFFGGVLVACFVFYRKDLTLNVFLVQNICFCCCKYHLCTY